MNARYLPLLVLLAAPVGAQGFNLDVGQNTILSPTPSSAYGAAAGQAGFWNDIDPPASPFFLTDLSGGATNVQIKTDSFGSVNVFPSVIPAGDDQKLLEDAQWLPNLGTVVAWKVGGIADGDYDVYTYASDPSSSTVQAEITVLLSIDPPQTIGGAWPGQHALGVTYARHRVTVVGGVVTILAQGIGSAPNDSALLNGFQFVPVGSGDIGTSYCGPAVANSTGSPAALSATGSVVAIANDVTLHATGLPPNQFGYFLNSMTEAFIQNPGGSQGNLCLGEQIGRYNATIFNSGAAGAGTLVLDLPNTPTPSGSTSIVAGETWNFTCWYRDNNPGPTSNFTDGRKILFQ